MAENDGILYVRSGDTVYKFDPDALQDVTTTLVDVDFEVFSAFQHYGQPGDKKVWRWFDIVQTGTCGVNIAIDPNAPGTLEFSIAINLTDTSFSGGHIAINRTSNSLGLQFTGSGIWRLDSVILDAKVLRGRG
jgi:hypothetical protein